MSEAEKQTRFLRLWDEVHDRLARFARGMTRDEEEARDLVSDTLLLAYEHFESVKSEKAFLSYVLTIARRKHWRNVKRRSLFGVFDNEQAENIKANSSSPESSYDVQVLYDALGCLPAKQRETVVLFEIIGLALEEVRSIQGGTLSGVKSRLKRGRERLEQIVAGSPMPGDNPPSLGLRSSDEHSHYPASLLKSIDLSRATL